MATAQGASYGLGVTPEDEWFAQGGVYQRAPIAPAARHIRQSVIELGLGVGPAVNFSLTPLLGSVIIAMSGINSQGLVGTTPTGGGVTTWNLIVQHTNGVVSGSRNQNIWWGVIDGTPTSTVNFTSATNGAFLMVEVRGLLGIWRDSIKSICNVSTSGVPNCVGPVTSSPSRVGLVFYGVVDINGSTITFPTENFTLIQSNNASQATVAMYVRNTTYEKDTDFAAGHWGSGNRTTGCMFVLE